MPMKIKLSVGRHVKIGGAILEATKRCEFLVLNHVDLMHDTAPHQVAPPPRPIIVTFTWPDGKEVRAVMSSDDRGGMGTLFNAMDDLFGRFEWRVEAHREEVSPCS